MRLAERRKSKFHSSVLGGIFLIALPSLAHAQSRENAVAGGLFTRMPVGAFMNAPSGLGYDRSGQVSPSDDSWTMEQGEVLSRPRPDYAAKGLRVGSFVALPSIASFIVHDSNVFAAHNNARSDTIAVIAPRFALASEWQRHALSLDFGSDIYRYNRFDSEDREDYGARLRARFDVLSDVNIVTTLRAARLHELRDDPSAIGRAQGPVPYDHYLADLTINKTQTRIAFSAGVNVSRSVYGLVPLTGGGFADEGYRTGNIYTAFFRPSYELSPGRKIFALAQVNKREFDGDLALNRDSQGGTVQAGLEWAFSRLLSAQVSAGYLQQDYSNAALKTVQGPAFAASLIWNPTPLMTIKAYLEREVGETTFSTASGRLDTFGGITLDYEVLRNLIIGLGARYGERDYIGSTRLDKLAEISTNVDYKLNRHVSVGSFYSYLTRDSSNASQSYDRHLVGIHAKAQY
jgi:hypothetical protein